MQDNQQNLTAGAPASASLQPADYAPAAAAPAVDPMAAKIEQWKRQHREVHQIDVQIAEGDVATCYIHNPNRNILAYALTRTLNKQLLEAGEFMLMNCWLGGDERCNPNSPQCYDPAVVAAAMHAAQSVEMLASNSKKL
ncbi:hypothetical protein P1X16_00920 [Hymenobacter sp. YC55]|nr:hypothetical protein [Hymenobacter sp. YC55]